MGLRVRRDPRRRRAGLARCARTRAARRQQRGAGRGRPRAPRAAAVPTRSPGDRVVRRSLACRLQHHAERGGAARRRRHRGHDRQHCCLVIGFATSRTGTRAGLGIVLCAVAAFAYAVAVIVQKPVLARVSPFQVTWLGCATATVACVPFAPALVGEVTADTIGWIVYLGLVPTALGFATWAHALRHTSAGRMAAL